MSYMAQLTKIKLKRTKPRNFEVTSSSLTTKWFPLSQWTAWLDMLLLMEEIPVPTTWDVKNLVNNGINYQPQQVQDFSHQQYHAYNAHPMSHRPSPPPPREMAPHDGSHWTWRRLSWRNLSAKESTHWGMTSIYIYISVPRIIANYF